MSDAAIEALTKAAEAFRMYEQSHQAKSEIPLAGEAGRQEQANRRAKAERNRILAEQMEAALSTLIVPNDDGRCPSDPGSCPSDGAASVSTVPASIPNAVTLVWASQGEYSDRREWPVVAYAEPADAQAAVVRMEALHRHMTNLYTARSDDLWDAGDYSGETLYETEAEGRELVRLACGAKWSLGSCYDEVTLSCTEVEVRTASGIVAATAGETEGLDERSEQSPVGGSRDAQPHSGGNNG